jgi:NTE family protein
VRRRNCVAPSTASKSSADLEGVDPTALETLAAGAVHFSLPAGDLLFESGSTPDGVYLLASGRLGVRMSRQHRPDGRDRARRMVGESGWLLKAPRSATVVALRDTELLLLPDALLDAVAAQSPQFSLAIAKLCARRLRRSNAGTPAPARARVFALVPNSDDIDVIELASLLVAELADGPVTPNSSGMRAPRLTPSAWFNRIEELNDYVVYVADWASPAGPGSAAGRPT